VTERSETKRIWSDVRDSVFQSALEEARDSVVERTTVTVDRKENGDTVRVCIVTDRERVSDRSRNDRAMYRTMVKTDTVYVEKRDSVLIKNEEGARASPLLMNLKWIFWIIIAMMGLVVVLRVRRV